jgi:Fe-S cluster assembly ATP-binding protein
MLELKNLHARIGETEILRGLSLSIRPGEVHAVMGPNASGKSTLSKVIAGHPDYEVTDGDVLWNGTSILELEPEERAQAGIFMSFQYPVAIPGVTVSYFLKAAMNAVRKAQGQEEIDAFDFLTAVREKMKTVDMDDSLLHRPLNEGFSGGEKKRTEILQMAMLEPALCILDEMDSGLDVDALKAVASGVNALRSPDRAMLVITHYQRLLDYLVPDFTHVLVDGRIVKSGDASLARDVERRGYQWVRDEMAATP